MWVEVCPVCAGGRGGYGDGGDDGGGDGGGGGGGNGRGGWWQRTCGVESMMDKSSNVKIQCRSATTKLGHGSRHIPHLFQGQSPVYNFYLHPQHKPCTSSPPSRACRGCRAYKPNACDLVHHALRISPPRSMLISPRQMIHDYFTTTIAIKKTQSDLVTDYG